MASVNLLAHDEAAERTAQAATDSISASASQPDRSPTSPMASSPPQSLGPAFDDTISSYTHNQPIYIGGDDDDEFGSHIDEIDTNDDDDDTQEFPPKQTSIEYDDLTTTTTHNNTNLGNIDRQISFLTPQSDDLAGHVINFPNGNSSSAFPNLSAVDEALPPELAPDLGPDLGTELETSGLTGDELDTAIIPRSSSPTKKSKSQERRNRAEEFTGGDINMFKYVPNFNYKYTGTEDFKAEIEEWFLYEDNEILPSLKFQFQKNHDNDWRDLSVNTQESLVTSWLFDLKSTNSATRRSALSFLSYVALGSYASVSSTADHIAQIKLNTHFLWKHNALPSLYALLVHDVNLKVPADLYADDDTPSSGSDAENELNMELFSVLTILYFTIESHRHDTEFAADLYKLNILLYFVQAMSRLRWGIEGNLPLRPICLVFWKTMLCLFGDDDDLARVKSYMYKKYNLPENNGENTDLVMASPLDYHAFRQDMMSRYPAYIPPSSRLPRNFDNSRSMSHYIEVPRPVIAQSSNNALPIPTVHIATPAPSPPASPAIAAGQKVRKSVFMTNQSFPFIHPTESNIPQSIVEASELFHSRIHTTPSMMQLWDERDKFMQQERGWVPAPREYHEFEESQYEELILERVEEFYVSVLGDLNSFVLVLLKFLLANASFSSSESHIDTYLSANQYAGTTSRAKDIGLRAVSACISVLASWFKISHICKFEHLSTLLFDSRYHLLVFKYFYSHVPYEKALEILDDPKLNFFAFCGGLSDSWNESQNEPEKPSQEKEEVDEENEDELLSSVTIYSRRYFFTTINLLRTLRRIIRKKTQRIIVVAELPPDTLRKALSIYQKDIWELVLEIFKEQVPFNGRKWRTTNMDLVSAIYLNCKTKLRDDWLQSGDLNSEAEDAQPQEAAVRALIQFYNERLRREYEEKENGNDDDGDDDDDDVATEKGDDEDDLPSFFALELDALAIDNSAM
ncbi:uncharacterized protein SAPINGB_P005725 [Magnusiomyces paraingens]|uniref:Factor arrest protein 11 n=1 Tax=Magnusiomyces paraingens TaxID=2606893 RepID=A0A5E8C1F3_9ASCO|nr:uncharacterized protein SAPINGB_P005725 [Saprochaete ingens]VVT57497.1 unnamed protein product [Saprochaete ingens]